MYRLLFIISLMSLSLFSKAQFLHLSDSAGPLANNDTIVMYGGDISIDVHAFITNESINDMPVMLKKTLFTVMPGSTNYYCWGVCYPADSFISTYPVMIQAHETDFLNFTGHYICQGNPGTAHIRYTFFDQQNSSDSVCVNVIYHACLSTGLAQQSEQRKLRQAYPNPASNVVNLPYSLTVDQEGPSFFEIRNLQGSLIQKLQLPDREGVMEFPLSGYTKGMYFCSLISNSTYQYTTKIVIQ